MPTTRPTTGPAAGPTAGPTAGPAAGPPRDWDDLVRAESTQPYWVELQHFVATERTQGEVYPPEADVLAALRLTPYADTRVVIIGQDPYHGPNQAHGLCFSVRPSVPSPPSLTNVFTELAADLGLPRPTHGNLEAWARQGVLLLNTCLTVRAGHAGSHHGQGWERFTDQVLRAVDAKAHPVVFILWGAPARAKAALIDQSRHVVITSAHPSPLSAYRGFFGSKPFSRTNEALVAAGLTPIDWRLPDAP